jgi:hypothetical protein
VLNHDLSPFMLNGLTHSPYKVAVEEQKELLEVMGEQERERENRLDELEDEVKILNEKLKVCLFFLYSPPIFDIHELFPTEIW